MQLQIELANQVVAAMFFCAIGKHTELTFAFGVFALILCLTHPEKYKKEEL